MLYSLKKNCHITPLPPHNRHFQSPSPGEGGGGELPYERVGDALQKFWIKSLKKTNLGVAKPFFDS